MAENRPPGKSRPFQKVPGARPARRNLFGRDPDKQLDDLARDREDLSQRQESEFKKHWNFDISTDTPQEGKYEWDEGIPLSRPTPLLHVPRTKEESARGRASAPGAGDTPHSVESYVTSLSDSISSGEFSQSVAGSSSDDMSSPSHGIIGCKSKLKRQRSPSPDENQPGPPNPPKR